jgi:hypothetical protein
MKITRFLPALLVVAALIGSPLMPAGAWSLNPFAASTSTEKKLNNPAVKPAPPKPSLLSRIGATTKGVFTSVGNAIVPAKSTAKMPTSNHFELGTHKVTPSAAQVESIGNGKPSSTTGSVIRSAAPSKAVQSAADWVGQPRVE